MLQEVNLEKAMKKAAAGKEVLILTTCDDGSKQIESLSDILEGARFLVEVPAVINEEFEKEFTDAAPPPTPKPGKRKPVDVGKIRALHNAGWPQAKIADEMGVSLVTVNKYVKRMEEDTHDNAESESC